MYNFVLPNVTDLAIVLFVIVGILLVLGAAGFGFGYLFIIWYSNKDREKQSLDSTLIQVTLPRDNEIKIDAAEQFFASFTGIKASSGMLSFLHPQPHLSFEIVGLPEDIRFYIYTPNKYKDLVEKQINGSYPDAE